LEGEGAGACWLLGDQRSTRVAFRLLIGGHAAIMTTQIAYYINFARYQLKMTTTIWPKSHGTVLTATKAP
jgi:hypothetical protein